MILRQRRKTSKIPKYFVKLHKRELTHITSTHLHYHLSKLSYCRTSKSTESVQLQAQCWSCMLLLLYKNNCEKKYLNFCRFFLQVVQPISHMSQFLFGSRSAEVQVPEKFNKPHTDTGTARIEKTAEIFPWQLFFLFFKCFSI